MVTNEDNLSRIQAICERLPFTRPIPIDDERFTESLCGDWNDVPTWMIRRMNFLIERERFYEQSRCPKGHEYCPRFNDPNDDPMTCFAVKHCYPYLCDGQCGHNEIWVSDDEKKILESYRKEIYG